MALVVYVCASDAVQLVDGTACVRNVPVELPDDIAASLLAQSTWRVAAAPKKPAPAADPKES